MQRELHFFFDMLTIDMLTSHTRVRFTRNSSIALFCSLFISSVNCLSLCLISPCHAWSCFLPYFSKFSFFCDFGFYIYWAVHYFFSDLIYRSWFPGCFLDCIIKFVYCRLYLSSFVLRDILQVISPSKSSLNSFHVSMYL